MSDKTISITKSFTLDKGDEILIGNNGMEPYISLRKAVNMSANNATIDGIEYTVEIRPGTEVTLSYLDHDQRVKFQMKRNR